jgi:FAD/FMN-containing dehydrogenase
VSIIPAGAGTWLDVGNPMRSLDLIITTSRMHRVLSHEPADLVSTAQAGATMAAFQEHIGQSGQWLPVDPPDDGTATLGGVIATGLGGPQSFGFGRPRSFVIGMRVALSDGRMIRAGGNVVKNVAGYDLCKLFTGSYGTLGLIVEVTFKLRPLPAETRTVVATGPLDVLLRGARSVIASDCFPVAIELMSASLGPRVGVDQDRADPVLLIKCAGASHAVVSQCAQALKLLRNETGITCQTMSSESDCLWSHLAAWPLSITDELAWRAAMSPTNLAAFLHEFSTGLAGGNGTSVRWQASLGEGRIRAIAKTEVYHPAVTTLQALRRQAIKKGGYLILENAPLGIKKEFDAWGDAGSVTELSRRVKSQLDPNGLFSPGRFVAGI